MHDHGREEKKYWLDAPRNVTLIVYGLAAICALLVLADLFYHKHANYGFESWVGFHGAYGFTAFFLIVLAGKHLRKVLMRKEDYYDR
jgi:hypothetical protein